MFARRGLVDQAAADFDQALRAGVKELDSTCNELIAFEPVLAKVALLRHEDLRWQRAVCRAFLRAGKPDQAAAFLDGLPPAQSGKWELVLERGNIDAYRSQWQAAADAFARAFAMREPDNPQLWFADGVLRLQIGDHAGYRDVSRTFLEYFGSTEDAAAAALVA